MSSSSSSDSSGPSLGGSRNDLRKLAERVQRKLTAQSAHEAMAVADHRKATEAMLKIRDILANEEEEPTREVKMALTCAGISVQRRVAFGTAPDDVDHGTFFVTTLALLYVLVVMCSGTVPRPSGAGSSDDDSMDVDQDDRHKAVATWEAGTLEAAMRAADGDESSSWGATLRHPGTLCQACLQTTAARSHQMTLGELANMGALFFRQSSQAFVASLLGTIAPREEAAPTSNSFLTLGALDLVAMANNNQEENLQSVADCGDSEAGQTVLRDLILSFKLPRSVVGVRRTSLLTREANKEATTNYSKTLGDAHDAAMHGTPWTYEKDTDITHKVCALLSGLAVQMFKHAQAPRKDDMFYGRVDLPFLETTAPPPMTTRLALIEHTHEWVVYYLTDKQQPIVLLRQQGFEGLKNAILLFRSKLSKE
jgi:hypothetical protein